jgi:hypothetical protein
MNFDLNIGNYKKKELEEMFDLPNEYNSTHIENRGNQLKKNVTLDRTINDTVRSKTVEFLNKAKSLLVSELSTSLENIFNMKNELIISPVTEAGNNFIIEKPQTVFTNSYPSEYFPGVINPLKKRTIKQNLNIDTRFRDNYYTSSASNFHFDLPIKFSNIMTIQLSAFEFPTTYFNISKQMGNNFFSIEVSDINYVITIPDGNYTPVALVAYLNNYVQTIITDLNIITFTLNIDSTGSGSGQLIIGTTEENNFFVLNFQNDIYGNPDTTNPLPLKLGWMLGYRNGIYVGNVNYCGEGIVDIFGPRYVYLSVDDYNNNVNNGFYSAFNSSILNKNILARISLSVSPFSISSQNNLSLITVPRQYFGPVDIQKLNIQLLDEYGRILELNNMDYSFCLTFTTIYDL